MTLKYEILGFFLLINLINQLFKNDLLIGTLSQVNLLFSINSHVYEFTFLLNFKLRHRKESKEETISFLLWADFCHSRQVQILGALAIFLEGKGCYCTFKIYKENSQYVRKIIPTPTGYVCFPLQCRSLQLQRATTLRIESSIMNVTRMFALNTYMLWFLEKIFKETSPYILSI